MRAYAAEQENPICLPKKHTIGIAEYKIVHAPDKLVTLGLGSCIGLVLYDPVAQTAGMVHIMLPSATPGADVTNRFKYADTAITDMIGQLLAAGAVRQRLKAKLAGGAHMFSVASTMNLLNVGQRNTDTCKRVLSANSIAVTGEDTGGTCGRSIEFCCESGQLSVRTVAPQSVRVI